MAAEGASMRSRDPRPPRWADAVLRSLLRPSDRETISGDLLEEYRAAQHPARGAVRANVWYVRQVVSVLWRLLWPCALALMGLDIVSRTIHIPWNVSLVPAPGVSLLDGLIYAWAGYRGAERSRLIRTGMLTATVISILEFTATFAFFAVRNPGLDLILVPFAKPFIFVILSLLLLQALAYGVAAGAVGGFIGKTLPPAPRRSARAS